MHPVLSNKTILQIIPTLRSGGAERTCVDITKALTDAGAKAIVVSAGGPMVMEIIDAGGHHIHLPVDSKAPGKILFKNVRSLRSVIRKHKVDLIHARSRAPAWTAYAAARLSTIPFMTTYHGIYSEKNALKRYYNGIMVRGETTIANSAYTASLIQKRYGTTPDKIEIIHRGTDIDLFNPDAITEDSIAKMREDWKLPEGRKIALLPARLTAWKGHRDALEAARILLKDKSVTLPMFVFVGAPQSQSYEQEIVKMAQDWGLSDHVKCVGHTNEMQVALALADIVIAPSTRPEAFGRSLAEASAMGKPAIGYNHGGTVEVINAPPHCEEHERTGWRIPVSNTQDLADTIATALTLTADEKQSLATRSRQRIVTLFSKQAMVSKTLATYSNVLTSVPKVL